MRANVFFHSSLLSFTLLNFIYEKVFFFFLCITEDCRILQMNVAATVSDPTVMCAISMDNVDVFRVWVAKNVIIACRAFGDYI